MGKTAVRRAEDEVVGRMDLLARFITRMEPEEIWSFLDALFPSLPEDDKEDLYGLVIVRQRAGETGGTPAEDVFAELERERGLVG